MADERIDVTGVVQGVGFRPFVYRLASELGLDGFVGNDSTRVFIHASGHPDRLDELCERLATEAPPLARVDTVRRTPLPTATTGSLPSGFHIADSVRAAGERTLIAPDTAPCSDCVAELRNPADRRYGHPFITCTNCGPRFTIIRDLPYDRPATTMAGFAVCEACRREYSDPSDRRYHAQPIACPDCGPTLRLITDGRATPRSDAEAIAHTADLLAAGAIVAIKGLGGFHLACDATNADAVATLRERKHRPDKAFAVMVTDLATARELAAISDAEATQLSSPARPVVLLRAHRNRLADGVAPGNPLVGLMLPSTPIHHVLFDRGLPPLVMTSANLSGQPLVHRDDDIDTRLLPLCDAVLTNDRPIEVPCDDSVVRVADTTLLPIRRSRGFAPLPVPVNGGNRTVLAVGGELKNAFCLASTDHAWMSQHIGDMANLEALDAFERSVADFSRMYGVEPDVVAIDAHPAYLTSKWARTHHRERVVEVQHHHAHIAAVMAEHECDPHEPVIGFAFDGTGYGDDGTIWGGEVLIADTDGYERVAHLAPVPLPGGDAAVRHPCRVALSHLLAAGVHWDQRLAPVGAVDSNERKLLHRQIERDVACVPTTSMGRLFDAVASLIGLRHEISYEAQAAIDLEHAAARSHAAGTGANRRYRFGLTGPVIDQRPVIRSIGDDLTAGVPTDDIALAFHHAVADAVVAIARQQRADGRGSVVALSGGVFQNALLTGLCRDDLTGAGFDVLTHHLVPPNDGGLALGQAFIASHAQPDPHHPATSGAANHPASPTEPVTTTKEY